MALVSLPQLVLHLTLKRPLRTFMQTPIGVTAERGRISCDLCDPELFPLSHLDVIIPAADDLMRAAKPVKFQYKGYR